MCNIYIYIYMKDLARYLPFVGYLPTMAQLEHEKDEMLEEVSGEIAKGFHEVWGRTSRLERTRIPKVLVSYCFARELLGQRGHRGLRAGNAILARYPVEAETLLTICGHSAADKSGQH